MKYSLDRENALVLDVVQAALGLISPRLRAIALRLDRDEASLHVAVTERTPQVDEDVDRLVFEFEALQDVPVKVEAVVHVGAPDLGWPGRAGRLVYLAQPV